ncbi:MAG: hypothetical protein KKA64_01815 [Nanoarchaeota archaeon]|nr:hypothetical protein [Nanoarchaeota archaeon]
MVNEDNSLYERRFLAFFRLKEDIEEGRFQNPAPDINLDVEYPKIIRRRIPFRNDDALEFLKKLDESRKKALETNFMVGYAMP